MPMVDMILWDVLRQTKYDSMKTFATNGFCEENPKYEYARLAVHTYSYSLRQKSTVRSARQLN